MYLQHITTERIEEHPQRVHLNQEYIYYYSHNNGSSQKACSPGYISPGESTQNPAVTHMSIRRHVLRRLAKRRKSLTPDYPKPDYHPPTQRFPVASPRTGLASGKLPTIRMSLPLCRQDNYYYCRVRAEFPYICSKCTISCILCVGDYTLPLDHSVLVRSDICHLGYHGDTWDYVWRT